MSQLEPGFAALERRVTPEIAAAIRALIAFEVGATQEGRKELDLRQRQGPFLRARGSETAACILRLANDSDWPELVAGRLTTTAALLAGKLHIDGDLTVAMQLERMVLAAPKR